MFHVSSYMIKPILVSGVQPTGKLHIGNYLGALKNFVDLQNSGKYQCYFFIADLHALTENPDAKDLSKNILNLAADFLAAGLDPKKSTIFLQSQIPAHSELMWILNTITPMGELERMTQFKNKAHEVALLNVYGKVFSRTLSSEEIKEGEENSVEQSKRFLKEEIEKYTYVGLFNYPVLMAADILLYNTKVVPVGNDQDQHLELTRTLARKFNSKFGKTFFEPQALHTKTPRVMSLANPEKKMSKSQPESCLFIDDSPEEIKNKIRKAVTDSGSEVKHDKKNKQAISNMLEIYSSLSNEAIPKIENKFKGKNYSAFKNDLAEIIIKHFANFRSQKSKLMKNQLKLSSALKVGSQKASKIANKKISEVKKKVGLI